jgi:hypothetical protein
MTAHKAQGQTLSDAIVDLADRHGTEVPYVMASWATSLEGLLILRPFEKKKGRYPVNSHKKLDKRYTPTRDFASENHTGGR